MRRILLMDDCEVVPVMKIMTAFSISMSVSVPNTRTVISGRSVAMLRAGMSSARWTLSMQNAGVPEISFVLTPFLGFFVALAGAMIGQNRPMAMWLERSTRCDLPELARCALTASNGLNLSSRTATLGSSAGPARPHGTRRPRTGSHRAALEPGERYQGVGAVGAIQN